MSKNINQVFIANPITSNAATDLMYFGQSPYGVGNDAAMTYANFSAQFVLSTSIINGAHGGTGVNNGTSTITIGGNFTMSGAFTFVGTLTNNTSVTFPVSGTLATTSQIPSLPFIVGAGGFYTTIQAAINAATVGATATNHNVVLINSGTYTENLTLNSFVDLASFGGINDGSVVIVGNAIYNPANDNETFSASGISFKTPGGGGSAFAINGVKICEIDLNECRFEGTTGTAFEITNVNSTTIKSSCHLKASAGQKILNMTNGALTTLNGKVNATDTASTLSGASNVVLSGCFDANAFILSGTAQLSVVNSVVLPPAALPFVDIGNTAIAIMFSNSVVSNAASGFWATGTGTIAANAITSNAGSAPNIDPALTEIREPLLVGKLSFNGGLNVFEQSGNFDVVQTYTGNTNVTFPTSGTLATTSQLPTLPLSLADGGTNANLTASNGGIVWSNATQLQILAGTITANLPLLSGSSATPSWGAFALSLGGALTTAGALTTSGAFGATFTFTNTTSVTFPVSGTLATTAQTFAWNDVSGTTQAAAVNNGYVISNASQTTVTLPATAAVGSVISVQGKGAAGWILAANTGQIIHFGNSPTSSAGSLTSTNLWDAVSVVCVTANTTWAVSHSIGTLTVA